MNGSGNSRRIELERGCTRDALHTLGGVSKSACRSRIRLFEPLTRNVPSTSVAASPVRSQ